jgi:hypothetical protein
MNNAIEWVTSNWQTIVGAIGGIVIAARFIVLLTPTPVDDNWYKRIVEVLKKLGLYIPVAVACLILLNSCSLTYEGEYGDVTGSISPEVVPHVIDHLSGK